MKSRKQRGESHIGPRPTYRGVPSGRTLAWGRRLAALGDARASLKPLADDDGAGGGAAFPGGDTLASLIAPAKSSWPGPPMNHPQDTFKADLPVRRYQQRRVLPHRCLSA